MDDQQQKWVLFWNRLLYPAIFDDLEGEKLTHYIENLSTTEIVFPNGKRKKPSLATLWRKLAAYRSRGLDGLCRRPRADRGKSRVLSQEIIDKAVEIKRDLPTRSAVTINTFIEQYYGKPVPPSTLYRHLKNAGATRTKLGVNATKVRCRWSRDHSNSLWLGDFQDGPMVLINGQAYRTHLSAFIDCHSRYVVAARYYLRENTAILIDTLLRAWQVCGKSRSLYLDNAKVYYSNALELACSSLHIRLLHRPVRDPQPGGMIEKFFQTTQSRFESEVRARPVMTLEELNRAFSAWLDMDYHETLHSETAQTPRERYLQGLVAVEPVDMSAAIRFFMLQGQRIVHRDFSDVSINGRLYKVDAKLRGDKVQVRYDPFGDGKEVLIYSLQEQYLGQGKLHERNQEQHPTTHPPSKQGQTQHDYLTLLVNKQEQKLRLQSQGIDFTQALKHRPWPFLAFVTTLARLMGRKGGTSAFNGIEYEALQKIYQRTPDLTEPKLVQAFEKSEDKNIVTIAFHLQQYQ